MESSNSSNPFALTLYFYYLFIRDKLNRIDLSKIIKKYKSKPNELLKDLATKYSDSFIIPSVVSQYEIERIKFLHEIPSQYLELISYEFNNSSTLKYDSKFDIYSNDFSALESLLSNTILAPNLSISPLDNMNKVKPLLPNEEGLIVDISLINKPKNQSDNKNKNNNNNNNKEVHIFEQIAQSTLSKHINGIESPLLLLYQLMKSNCRARILIRRGTGIRGSLDAFIKAFDVHFNMILVDVDEEYISNQQSLRKLQLGKFVQRNNIIKRHIPKLILRGDNVVLVFRVPVS